MCDSGIGRLILCNFDTAFTPRVDPEKKEGGGGGGGGGAELRLDPTWHP